MVFDEYFKDRMIHSVVLNMFLLKSINFQNHSSSLLWFQALFLQNIKVKQSALNWNLQYKRKRPLVRALYNIGLNHTITGHQLTATITGLNYRTIIGQLQVNNWSQLHVMNLYYKIVHNRLVLNQPIKCLVNNLTWLDLQDFS